jgi:DNA polymerase-3 subunit delta
LSPEQFLQRIRKTQPSPVYLFLGPEAYQRGLCRRALIQAALPDGDLDNGLTRLDLEETSISEVIDDARSLSLFAANRLIWVSGAETALPRRLTDTPDESSGAALLADYLQAPTPGTVLVFESSRYDF